MVLVAWRRRHGVRPLGGPFDFFVGRNLELPVLPGGEVDLSGVFELDIDLLDIMGEVFDSFHYTGKAPDVEQGVRNFNFQVLFYLDLTGESNIFRHFFFREVRRFGRQVRTDVREDLDFAGAAASLPAAGRGNKNAAFR